MVSRTSLGVSAYASIVSGDFLRVGRCAQIGRTKPGERGNVKVKDDTRTRELFIRTNIDESFFCCMNVTSTFNIYNLRQIDLCCFFTLRANQLENRVP